MSPTKLKIHTDRSVLAPGQPHVVMLFPFWGKNPEIPGAPDTGRFDDYAARGGELFELTSLAESDVAVLAGEWVAGCGRPQAYAYCEQARKMGKPVIIFFNNDSDEEVPVEGAIIFRTSTRRSCRRPNVFGLPAWPEDFVGVYRGGNLPIRSRQGRPVVGYCGYGAIHQFFLPDGAYRLLCSIPFIRRLVHYYSGSTAKRFRSKVLSQLHRSAAVQTNFLLRTSFWNGTVVNGVLDPQRARQSRIEYVNNMFDSDYIMCSRGAGNFSFRFYEVLCSGRIPLFIDTDCLLPHDRWINWRDYCVWVDETEVTQVADRLVSFHASLSPVAFEEIQHACRRLWLEWLSPTGFFSQIHRYLR
jgi:hypothetical protein